MLGQHEISYERFRTALLRCAYPAMLQNDKVSFYARKRAQVLARRSYCRPSCSYTASPNTTHCSAMKPTPRRALRCRLLLEEIADSRPRCLQTMASLASLPSELKGAICSAVADLAPQGESLASGGKDLASLRLVSVEWAALSSRFFWKVRAVQHHI